ncbi:unnamed protein product [Aphanomyces euteiches]
MQAVKWLGMDKDGKMTVSPAAALKVLQALPENQDVNLISIFGAARQGKSFLMNLLANQQDLFRISNEKEPCTQGVDLSSHFMPLSSFSTINGCPRVNSSMSVGFVDAEGQGDRDITYDSRLVSPVLLASKVVIFNWKDSLQADRMLNLLAVLAKAAQNVELAEGETRKVFGHLHIVFRDWNFINTTPTEVHDTLFKKEKGASREVSNRNLARHELVEAFESINIWLFPLPVVSTAQLSERIRFEQLQPSFQKKLRELRTTISQQLEEPMLFNQQPLTGRTLAEMMPLFAESLNDNRVIMPESIYSSMRRAEGKKIQLQAEEAMKTFCKAQLDKPEILSTEQFAASVRESMMKMINETLSSMKSFPSDVRDECRAALLVFVDREVELTSKSNNEKVLRHFQNLMDQANDGLRDSLKEMESKLPLPPADLTKQCDFFIRQATKSLQSCPKTSMSSSFQNDIQRLEEQGNVLKERLQHLNERALRQRSAKLMSELTSCKNKLKTKGNSWLDKHITSEMPFTISMLEEELLRVHSSFEFDEPKPDLDEIDIEGEMQEYHAQLLDDLKRQYTLHVRHIVLQFIAKAKLLLEKEMQAIVLPMPEAKLHARILESKERVVVDISKQMQGWSIPEEEIVHFGNAVSEHTKEMEVLVRQHNQTASRDSALQEAAARYKEAKDNLTRHLTNVINEAIPMSDEKMQKIYDEALLKTCATLSDGNQTKRGQVLESLKADMATLMEQFKTINLKERENAVLASAAENQRHRVEALTDEVQKSQALAAKREQEMKSQLLEKEHKSKHLQDELSVQAAKTQALERQLQEWQEKSKKLADEKKRVEKEALQMASKERQAAQRFIDEQKAKEAQMEAEFNAIQKQLLRQQQLLQEKEREARAAEAAKELARKEMLEKDKALKIAQQEREMREKLSRDVLAHKAQAAELESKISSVMLEKSIETQQLKGNLTEQQRKTQQLELELKRMKDEARALDEEREHWRRQALAMEETKRSMADQVAEESARREAAEAAAQQAARAAEVAARAAMEAVKATPEKKRKPEVPATSSAKKSRKLAVKDTLPKLSLQEAKRLAKEEMDKRIGERISKMKK